MHEIINFFLPKDFFWGIMKVPSTKNIHNFFQGPSNPGFRSVKVQTETFLKKDSRDFKNYFQFRFLLGLTRDQRALSVVGVIHKQRLQEEGG